MKGADMGDELYVEGMDDAFLEWRAQHGQEWAPLLWPHCKPTSQKFDILLTLTRSCILLSENDQGMPEHRLSMLHQPTFTSAEVKAADLPQLLVKDTFCDRQLSQTFLLMEEVHCRCLLFSKLGWS